MLLVSNQRFKRKATPPGKSDGPSPAATPESRARQMIKPLWQAGDLVHMTTRYPRKRQAARVDRLAGILKRGLVAPARCRDGSVFSDLNIVVTGCSVPYDSLVFLHRFGAVSYIYTLCEPGRFAVFLDPATPVLTPEAMGPNWCMLSQDEVYVRDRIGVEKLTGVAVHPADGNAVRKEFMSDFLRLGIPLYDYDGNVLWPR
jgi:hypothetical protein